DELDTGQPKQLLHATTVQDGYMETKAIKSVWAVKEPDGEIKVFSPLCPHLGCAYRSDNDKGKFACRCHGSVHSITRQLLAGHAFYLPAASADRDVSGGLLRADAGSCLRQHSIHRKGSHIRRLCARTASLGRLCDGHRHRLTYAAGLSVRRV